MKMSLTRPLRSWTGRVAVLIALPALLAAVGLTSHAARRASVAQAQNAVPVAPFAVPISAVFAIPVPGGQRQFQLEVFDSVSNKTRVIGTVDHYTEVRWSPKGGMFAALAGPTGPGQSTTLHLVNAGSGADRAVGLADSAHATYLVWSPDGTRVAVLGSHVLLLDQSGTTLADAPAPAAAAGSSAATTPANVNQQSGGGYARSPDGQRFAAVVNGNLAVVGHDGSEQSVALTVLLPGASAVSFVGLMGWQGSDQIVLEGGAASQLQGWLVSVVGTPTAQAEATANLTYTPIAPPPPPSASAQASLNQLAPNSGVIHFQLSADGSAAVYELRLFSSQPTGTATPASGGAAPARPTATLVPNFPSRPPVVGRAGPLGPATLVVIGQGSPGALQLPPTVTDTRNGQLVDVVVGP